jgi:hypothetical protein
MPATGTTVERVVPQVVKPEEKKLVRGYHSFLLITLIVLSLMDLTARFTYPMWTLDHYNSPNRSGIWWATKDFLRQPATPDVVLLGSSLMMTALHGGDATYLGFPQNVVLHHQSAYLQKLMREKSQRDIQTFSFAICGQMASDAYAITRVLLKGDKQPQTIIYGIAPRDLMDNTLASPASTETFRYLSRVGDLSDIAYEARPSMWDAIDCTLGRISFLYEHKLDLIYLETKYVKQIMKMTGYGDLENVHTPVYVRQLAMLDLPEDTGPNEILISSYRTNPEPYRDNLHEYAVRYRQFNRKLFNQQLGYLQGLLQICKNRHIQLILVNMPLTQDNLNLMPQGFYQSYLNTVSDIATKYGGNVLDLNDTKIFPKEDFADSAHLNGQGGMHFFEVLSDRLAASTSLSPVQQN